MKIKTDCAMLFYWLCDQKWYWRVTRQPLRGLIQECCSAIVLKILKKKQLVFLVKLQERSMQLNCIWTISRAFFKDFNQKFISPTLWNSHFHNTKFRRTPLSGCFWPMPFWIYLVWSSSSSLFYTFCTKKGPA